MSTLATNRQSTEVRPVRPGDVRSMMKLIDTAWRVHLRIAPTELPTKIDQTPGFLAEDSVGLRGFLMMEPLPSKIGLIVVAALRDTWSVKPYLDLLLPEIEQAAQSHNLQELVYIGNASWLRKELERRGFQIQEWIIAYERQGTKPPDPPVLAPAQLRTAHYTDLPALIELDDLVFDHIWHKSAGSFSEALARADSFTVAIIDGQVVAYHWCEIYGNHAHLTRLAVHPDYQGQGVGAQLLHQAIVDVLAMEADLITLNTQEKNRRSQALYKRFGFVDTRQRMPVLSLDLKPAG